MYRVTLTPTEESPNKVIWLEAQDVHETDHTFWDFVDQEDQVILRLEKSGVTAIEITKDRQKARYSEDNLLEAVFSGKSALDPPDLENGPSQGHEDLDQPTSSS